MVAVVFHRQLLILASTASRLTLALGGGPAFTGNGTSSTLSLTTGATSLTDVRDAINNAAIGVTASIIEVSTGSYSLMVKSPEGAENAMRITTSLSGAAVDVMKYDPENNGVLSDSATQVVAATDAAFTIDGISVTRPSNTITDLFSGITLELDNVSASDMGTTRSSVRAILKLMLWQRLKQSLARSIIYFHF